MILFNYPAWTTATQLIVVIISVAIFLIARRRLIPKSVSKSIPSPRDTLLPSLTPSEVSALPYAPNVLPGARDVDSPYGIMRCYEWGPEKGRKVVLVHGDTTPAPMLGPIAEKLAERDCRVLVLGKWREWGKRGEMVATFPLTMADLVFFSCQTFGAEGTQILRLAFRMTTDFFQSDLNCPCVFSPILDRCERWRVFNNGFLPRWWHHNVFCCSLSVSDSFDNTSCPFWNNSDPAQRIWINIFPLFYHCSLIIFEASCREHSRRKIGSGATNLSCKQGITSP